ncbi:LysM peptidoglycan-binding domain-containing protein, partial [Clostridium sp.]|uniref:LysM peptidoglycan-binding domain-containing protein n=1 Tax=Clostridium sp. TaxID=1506 RepID=UPI003F35CDA6
SYPLWIAEYGVTTPQSNPIWSSWIGFQYSDAGSINGVGGNVDLDVFTDYILLSNHSPIPNTPTRPSNTTSNSGNVIYYVVQPGDSLSEIASKYNTTVNSLIQLNNISNPNLIYPGQTLKVYSQNAPSSGGFNSTYVVQSGDTLSEIAAKFNTTVNELASINGISDPNLIYPGEVLKVSSSSNSNSSSSSYNNTYIVQSGDTLGGIAAKFGTTADYLAQINGISNPNLIFPGEVIKLSSSASTVSRTYVVKSGDTLSEIAAKFGTTTTNLAQINGISDPNLIYPGQVLKV